MKKILFILVLLFSLSASAQVDTTKLITPVQTNGFSYKHLQAIYAMLFPTDTFQLKSTWRGIAFKDTLPYFWTGKAFRPFGSGGGSADGKVDSVRWNSVTNTLTIYQDVAADQSVYLPPSYLKFDSSYTALGGMRNDSTGIIKSIRIRRNSVTVNPTMIGDSLMYWDIPVPDTTSLSDRINAKLDTAAGWKITGNYNTDTATNFIGTKDQKGLRFKVNNIHAGFITTIGTGVNPASQAGSLVLGQYAGYTLGTYNNANTLLGHGAGTYIAPQVKGGQNTFVGTWAGHATREWSDPFGGRSVLVGQSAGFRNYNGSSLTYIGAFAGESNNQGNVNTGIGRDALRGNIDGSFNTAVGWSALLYNTTGIKTITVTNGGSGYTTATVTISLPPTPAGVINRRATATAVISGGAITAINVTDPGKGYTILYGVNDFHAPITVTITGDGTGATATVTETVSAIGNTALGYGAGINNELGKYNIEIGYLTSLKKSGDDNILMGRRAGTSLLVANNSLFIGFDAGYKDGIQKDTCNGCIVIGHEAYTDEDSTAVIGGNYIKKTKLKGILKDSTYGSGSVTGTAAYMIGVASDGTFVETSAAGGTTYKIGTFDSQTRDANGAAIVGDSIYMQNFDAENPGLVPPGGSSSTFLRGDGTWQTVAGGTVYVDSTSSNATGDSLIVIKGSNRYAYKYPSGTSGLTKGTTTIASSATRRLLYDSSGVLSNNANLTYNTSGELLLATATDNGNYKLQVGGDVVLTGGSIKLTSIGSSRIDYNAGAVYVFGNTEAVIGTGSSTTWLKAKTTGLYLGGDGTAAAKVHLAAGTATAGTAPLMFTSGTKLTTAVAGAVEYDGTNLFFTPSSATRNTLLMTTNVNSVSPTSPNRTITVVIGGTTYYIAAKTTND